MLHGLDLYCADSAQHVITWGWDPDYLDHDLPDLWNVPLTLSPTKPVIPEARALQRPPQSLCPIFGDFGLKLGGGVTGSNKKQKRGEPTWKNRRWS